MPLPVLGLLLVAAVLHAGWNMLVKRAREKQVFTWWALVVGSSIFLVLWITSQPFPLRVWPYVIVSALVEGAYFLLLARAYEHGDFSLVYPMARGTAPAFLAIWAVIFLGERPGLYGWIGLSLLFVGLIVVGGKNWWALRKTASLSTSGVALALGVALCISVYSVIDGAAVHIVPPLPYTVLVIGLSAVFTAPIVGVRYGLQAVALEWRSNWPRIILVGILSLTSYALVLFSYSIARVSYAGAVREVSVVFAAFMGWRWLGEDFGLLRIIGASIIFVGILVIAIAG